MAVSMNLVNISDQGGFDGFLSSSEATAVHFWAPWCEPCAHMDKVFAELAAENPGAKFLRVEAEEFPEISEKYDVSAVPFFLFFKNGSLVDRLEGADPSSLADKIARHVSPSASATSSNHLPGPSTSGSSGAPIIIEEILKNAQKTTNKDRMGETGKGEKGNGETVNGEKGKGEEGKGEEGKGGKALIPGLKSRLESLVGSEEVLVFMKGSPEEPKCGFSSKVVKVLKEVGRKFGSFDILRDGEVREGMKEFSDWPTFPQVYVRGEFIGGCDIILEMYESGELKKVLEGEGEGEGEGEVEGVEERLKKLVNSSKTMLFMKGTPETPRCGFSRKVVDVLKKEGFEFGSFDIFSDEEVRGGLKELSNWPTYPQLYHNGEFLGGCDIVLEMHKSGELKEVLES